MWARHIRVMFQERPLLNEGGVTLSRIVRWIVSNTGCPECRENQEAVHRKYILLRVAGRL